MVYPEVSTHTSTDSPVADEHFSNFDMFAFNVGNTGTVDNLIPAGTEVVVQVTEEVQEGHCEPDKTVTVYRIVNIDAYFVGFSALNRYFNNSIRPEIIKVFRQS